MRSPKASAAKPRSPTIQPGPSGRQSSRPGAIGSSCAGPGASAKAMARPRPSGITQAFHASLSRKPFTQAFHASLSRKPWCRNRRESGPAPHAHLAPCCRPPFFRARRLVVSPDGGAIDEGHAERDAALLDKVEQVLPHALLGPADEELCRQPPRAEF